jgi:hypothetical protein
MDSHSMLQYLPEVTTHEQPGCTHFRDFGAAISLPQLPIKGASSKSKY